jgi:hypothetical protein
LVERSGGAVDVSVSARGVLSTGVGGRADLLIFDDVVDQKNAILFPKMRRKVIDSFGQTWMSRLEPDGRALFIGTPWHLEDLTHVLLEQASWSVLRMPISEDCTRIDMEIYNPPSDYPIPRAA